MQALLSFFKFVRISLQGSSHELTPNDAEINECANRAEGSPIYLGDVQYVLLRSVASLDDTHPKISCDTWEPGKTFTKESSQGERGNAPNIPTIRYLSSRGVNPVICVN